jgi:phage protein U
MLPISGGGAARAPPSSSCASQRDHGRTSMPQQHPQYSGHKSTTFEVSIGSLDTPSLTVTAQYRPKDLQVVQSVPWTKHSNKSDEGTLQLEFSGAEGRTTTLELFFDASETQGGTVAGEIGTLAVLARVRNPTRKEDEFKRPHHCVLVFGRVYTGGIFPCVIESMTTKYTMFSPDGEPIRATVTLQLKEANRVDMSDEQKKEKAQQEKSASSKGKTP